MWGREGMNGYYLEATENSGKRVSEWVCLFVCFYNSRGKIQILILYT